MGENNDFNLLISDEEGGNLISNRTLQNTHSPPNHGQFIRRNSDKTKGENASQNRMASPQFTETFGSGTKTEQLTFPSDNFFSPKGTWDNVDTYGSLEDFNPESHKKTQFVKKSKRQTEEVYVEENDPYQGNSKCL